MIIAKYKMPFPLTATKEWHEPVDFTYYERKKVTQKAKYIVITDRGYLNALVLDIIDENDCVISPKHMNIQDQYMKIYRMWQEGKLQEYKE